MYLYTPRYSWNTTKVGVKLQTINRSTYANSCHLYHHSIWKLIKKKSTSLIITFSPKSVWVWFLAFTSTFSSISVILWRSVLLVEETGENHQPAASHWQILSHNVASNTPTPWAGFELTTLLVIGTDCISSCRSKYRTITTTTTPYPKREWHRRYNAYPSLLECDLSYISNTKS